MEKQKNFRRKVFKLAFPVTLQSLLQSSFSVIDQIMIGKLGSGSIAGIGLGGKFVSIYSVVLASIAAAAGIMISQYMGARDEKSVSRSFFVNLTFSVILAVLFLLLCILFPEMIMGVYTKDGTAKAFAADYICIYSMSFLPMAVSSIVTTMLRCMGAASLPLYASIFSLFINTGLNYMLIFGKWIFPAMGVRGAAFASVVSQLVLCVLLLVFFLRCMRKQKVKLMIKWHTGSDLEEESRQITYRKQYIGILGPMLICEFLWSLGENVYAAVYGNMSTDACAAMTMTIPIQTLVIGALSGLSQASAILIGKSLGAKEYDRAYQESKKLMLYGIAGSVCLSLLLVVTSPLYVRIYQVDSSVRLITRNILIAFAIISPVKVLNMILGGGIIRSGGKTKYIMWVDFIGTWLFGVPLALLSAFVFKLQIAQVYFILSMEECVRLGISLVMFKKKIWMKSLK